MTTELGEWFFLYGKGFGGWGIGLVSTMDDGWMLACMFGAVERIFSSLALLCAGKVALSVFFFFPLETSWDSEL